MSGYDIDISRLDDGRWAYDVHMLMGPPKGGMANIGGGKARSRRAAIRAGKRLANDFEDTRIAAREQARYERDTIYYDPMGG